MPREHCLEYDIVIIGAGHAGCEAALAAARLGCRTALVTLSADHLAQLPCNPSIGGIGKGQLVREIDALGGEMGRLTDRAALQIKRLNGSKGPAVQALRAQVDKLWYPRLMRRALAGEANLNLLIGEAAKLFVKKGRLAGIGLVDGRKLTARAAILTTGTFLRGSLTLGARTWPGGRIGEKAAVRLAKALGDTGFELSRFQTATPPRVRRDTVDFAALRVEPGSVEPLRFSFVSPPAQPLQIPCHLTYTTVETHDVVRHHLPRSPIRSGAVTEHGPRNCPSIDRKVLNFPDKTAHPVFVEPESLVSDEMYLQGLTTAMPADAQDEIIRTVPGLEKAVITRYGYAVSYDYLPPNQLTLTLETKLIKGLFAAGQINGTTGYEEAAAQGLLAGINAALACRGEDPLVLGRDEAYIGVLIDDLVTKGVAEPYRVYTSRAEFRLKLRSDNADLRLTPVAERLGLASAERQNLFAARRRALDELKQVLRRTRLTPTRELNELLKASGGRSLRQAVKAESLLARPGITLCDLRPYLTLADSLDAETAASAEIDIKYTGYLKREVARVAKYRRLEDRSLPVDLDYSRLRGISFEAGERLNRVGPSSLGQAARVSGVSPADISLLMVHLERLAANDDASS